MQEHKKTLVLGVSLKTERASNQAARMLQEAEIPAYLFGFRAGEIEGKEIQLTWPQNECFETVTLYLNPKRQEEYIQQIIELKPLRVIFNPGTENPTFMNELAANNIESQVACTLVLLRTNQY